MMKNRFASKILMTLFCLITLSGAITAQQKKVHIVKQGETLYSISKALDVTLAELKQWNNLAGNEISVDQELVYFTEGEASENSVPVNQADTTSLISSTPSTPNTFYLVKSGDSLYKIARENNMTVQQLRDLNNLTSDNLRIGQRLAVKSVESVAPVVSEFSEESSPQGKFVLYPVSNSESLESILSKFQMTEPELSALNPNLDLTQLNLVKSITVLLPPSKSFDNPYLEKANLEDLGSVPVSVYSDEDSGEATTNGELYNPKSLTAAHSNISIGSVIFIENPANGKGVYVRINDRVTNAGLKLSRSAFRILGLDADQPQTVTIYIES